MADRTHACPACNCNLGQYALVGYELLGRNGLPMTLEGLIAKVQRLTAELARERRRRR